LIAWKKTILLRNLINAEDSGLCSQGQESLIKGKHGSSAIAIAVSVGCHGYKLGTFQELKQSIQMENPLIFKELGLF
jgi:hypothetical protein